MVDSSLGKGASLGAGPGCQWMRFDESAMVDSSHGRCASRGEGPGLPMDDALEFSVVDSSLAGAPPLERAHGC